MKVREKKKERVISRSRMVKGKAIPNDGMSETKNYRNMGKQIREMTCHH